MNTLKNNVPEWDQSAPVDRSFRSIFKWGRRDFLKVPSPGFVSVIRDSLALSDTDLAPRRSTGDEPVPEVTSIRISAQDLSGLEALVGRNNLSRETYDRLKYATGKSMEDILMLRQGLVSDLSDVVIHPRDKQDVAAVVSFCHERHIPVQVHGGGSSVTRGLACCRGGVTLVMGTHMRRLLNFNETNQTITVEPGMMGPAYESLLNQAPEKLGASRRYTGGHFPQSFEHSSVGGWIVTLGAGQASSYYGDACDLVVSQEYVTPVGSFRTLEYPGTATGPRVSDMMMGSEGCFGVLVSVTLKVFRYFPKNTRRFAFMFPDWKSAVAAGREISQGEFGMPSIFRISDPEETDVALKMYGLDQGILGRFLSATRRFSGQRCLVMGQTEGEKRFSASVKRSVKQVCRHYRGLYLTAYPMNKWYHGRFSDPYMRDVLNDHGVLIDTLESSVTWDNIDTLYHGVRSFIKGHPNTICMTHASHFYAQGTNLYFIFITRMQDLEAFRRFQRGIIEQILAHKGSLSHHHGVGKSMGPFMETHLGKEQMAAIRALKTHFDPHGIMNPGGTLGLD
ncbi:MAG: FAD-binding oxidoreductase [Pseudomonadota bacterium]